MIQPSCVSLTELDLCHQPAFPNIFYHTMQSYVLQVFEIVATTAGSVDFEPLDPGKARTCEKKRRYPSDISSFSHLIESTRRRRTSGGRSPATTAAERRHSNCSSPAGLEHRKKSHPSDDPFSISLRARDGIRTRDPRLGKAILHH